MANMFDEGRIIDLSAFAMENHVEQSLRAARTLAGDRPANAGDLLTGALVAGRTISGSRAFAELASMAPLSGVPDISELKLSEEKPTSLLVNDHLAEAFSVAEPFLKEAKAKIWGRDYITLALLVDKDPISSGFCGKSRYDCGGPSGSMVSVRHRAHSKKVGSNS